MLQATHHANYSKATSHKIWYTLSNQKRIFVSQINILLLPYIINKGVCYNYCQFNILGLFILACCNTAFQNTLECSTRGKHINRVTDSSTTLEASLWRECSLFFCLGFEAFFPHPSGCRVEFQQILRLFQCYLGITTVPWKSNAVPVLVDQRQTWFLWAENWPFTFPGKVLPVERKHSLVKGRFIGNQ